MYKAFAFKLANKLFDIYICLEPKVAHINSPYIFIMQVTLRLTKKNLGIG